MHHAKDHMLVNHWMTPNPQIVGPEVSVRSAFYTMRSQGFRHLVVIEDGKLAGIVTDRDLRRPDLSPEPDGWNDYYQLDEDYEVRHVMTTRVETVAPGDPLEKALRLFVARRFGALPVVDRIGRVVGILSVHDVLRAFEAHLGREMEAAID